MRQQKIKNSNEKYIYIYIYQLHIYNKIYCYSIEFTNSFFTNFDFSLLQEWEYQYKEINKTILVKKLRETRLTLANHNQGKSN